METVNTIKKKIEQNKGASDLHKKVMEIIEKYENKRKELDKEMFYEILDLNDFEWNINAYEYFLKSKNL
jgi:hypothetical protein